MIRSGLYSNLVSIVAQGTSLLNYNLKLRRGASERRSVTLALVAFRFYCGAVEAEYFFVCPDDALTPSWHPLLQHAPRFAKTVSVFPLHCFQLLARDPGLSSRDLHVTGQCSHSLHQPISFRHTRTDFL